MALSDILGPFSSQRRPKAHVVIDAGTAVKISSAEKPL